MLVLIYLPWKDRKLSWLRRKRRSHKHKCQPQNFEKRETFLWVDFYLSCSGWLKISVLATVSVWQCSGVSMTGYEDDGWQRVHYKNRLKQSVRCLIFVLQGWRINPFEFSNIMTLDSVVSPQVLNKYLISVDVKSGRFSTKEGERETRQKSVSWHLCIIVSLTVII